MNFNIQRIPHTRCYIKIAISFLFIISLISSIIIPLTPSEVRADGCGWEWVNPLPNTDSHYGIWGSSASDIFIAGYYGGITHYDGSNWTTQSPPSINMHLYDVWGASPTSVYAVGFIGQIIHYNGTKWSEMESPATNTLRGIWGISDNCIYAVGEYGKIFKYSDSAWSEMNSGTTTNLNAVWGTTADNVYAVGDSGTILHYDGSSWSSIASGTTNSLRGIWGLGSSDIYAVGEESTILHFNGEEWAAATVPGDPRTITDIWGSATDNLYAVSYSAYIYHWDGLEWSFTHPFWFDYNNLYGIWGSAADNIYAVGAKGTIFQYTDAWSSIAPANQLSNCTTLYSIWGAAADNIFATSSNGYVARYNGANWSDSYTGTNQTLYGIWGTSGSDVFAVGNSGTIRHFNGIAWSGMTSNTAATLYGVWGNSANDVYAVGEFDHWPDPPDYTIIHYNGSEWSEVASGSGYSLRDIWGTGPDNVYAVGRNVNLSGGVILHYDGSDWSTAGYTSTALNTIWGTAANDIFTGGYNGPPYHYNGTNWLPMANDVSCHDIWGSSGNDVFTGGSYGAVYYYDGNESGYWGQMITTGAMEKVYGIWGSSNENVYAVGTSTGILHYGGRCPGPQINVNPQIVDFGTVQAGNIVEQIITVTNTGEEDLNIGELQLYDSARYSKIEDNCSNTTLAPSESATVKVTFRSYSVGNYSARLLIFSNDPVYSTFIVDFSATCAKTIRQVETATGTGTATFSINGGTIDDLTAQATTDCGRTLRDLNFPHGFFSFTIDDITPGSTITITITLPSSIPQGAQYWKCIDGQWVNVTSLLGDNDGDNVLTLTITDGGPGDADGVVNGSISDPGGPATMIAAEAEALTFQNLSTNDSSAAPTVYLPGPANMVTTTVLVQPQKVAINQPVKILANIANRGDIEGHYNAVLKINGEVIDSQNGMLGGNLARPIEFQLTPDEAGTYYIDINGKQAFFTVVDNNKTSEARNAITFFIVLGSIAVVILIILLLIRRNSANNRINT